MLNPALFRPTSIRFYFCCLYCLFILEGNFPELTAILIFFFVSVEMFLFSCNALVIFWEGIFRYSKLPLDFDVTIKHCISYVYCFYIYYVYCFHVIISRVWRGRVFETRTHIITLSRYFSLEKLTTILWRQFTNTPTNKIISIYTGWHVAEKKVVSLIIIKKGRLTIDMIDIRRCKRKKIR